MKPSMQISWDYVPQSSNSSSGPSLEDNIATLKRILDYEPEKFNGKYPFSGMSEEAAQQFQQMAQDNAFDNPIPKHTGNPEYIGPYYVGSTLLDPRYSKGGDSEDSDGTDSSITDSFKYSLDKGLISQDVADYKSENLLDDTDTDYMALVKSGDLSLEDAIRMLGYVPHNLRGLLGE